MTDHQLLMQAVGEFWASLRNVRVRGDMEMPHYECTFDPPPGFQRAELMPYQQAFADRFLSPEYRGNWMPVSEQIMYECASEIHRRFVQREMERFLSSGTPGCFDVFFPHDDKFMLPLSVLCRVPSDTRTIVWWLTKRGIDFGRVRGVSQENGQDVVRIAI